jgi:hypothetical protein
MLFPERDLAYDFWVFVYEIAIDPRLPEPLGERPGGRILYEFESNRSLFHGQQLAHADPALADRPRYSDGTKEPLVYPTMQEALLGYLIYLVTAAQLPGEGRFACTYDIWLRTVVLLMADIAQNPEWLHIVTGTVTDRDSRQHHHMTVSNDWDCLSQDTFNYVVQSIGTRERVSKPS